MREGAKREDRDRRHERRRIQPGGYKPQRVTAALRVVAGNRGINNGEEMGAVVQLVSPIDNKVESVFVHVTDLRRSAEWYSMIMGLPLLEERLNGGNVYWLNLRGGTGLILDDNRSNSPDTPHVRFMYKTDDIEAAFRYAEEKGIPTIGGIDRPHEGLAFFRFVDPDGNAIMVTQSDYVSDVVEKPEDAESPIQNRIGGIFLNVTDMNRAIRFHSEALGVAYKEVADREEDSIYDLPMRQGSSVLLDVNRAKHGDAYQTLFMFVAKDVDGAKAYLASKGVPVFTDIERHGDIAFFTVKDPDGNVIMICIEVNE
ncbi:VOC family protein [Paenibacillus silvisoli]|uniref:VOC family protein n=1 Tax=Paenibacillus silvisoli TaxID=3110539 RepID=UPI00280411FE|nr:VOC family protein [Paenibacillus silvisoli]